MPALIQSIIKSRQTYRRHMMECIGDSRAAASVPVAWLETHNKGGLDELQSIVMSIENMALLSDRKAVPTEAPIPDPYEEFTKNDQLNFLFQKDGPQARPGETINRRV